MKEKVAILGASAKPERYSYMAYKMLKDYGHEVYPVHPSLGELEGQKVYTNLSELAPGSMDTVTLYVNPKNLVEHMDALIALKPKRVIFNPGTEDKAFEKRLESLGIKAEEACTLVLLRTRQFERD